MKVKVLAARADALRAGLSLGCRWRPWCNQQVRKVFHNTDRLQAYGNDPADEAEDAGFDEGAENVDVIFYFHLLALSS